MDIQTPQVSEETNIKERPEQAEGKTERKNLKETDKMQGEGKKQEKPTDINIPRVIIM